MEEDKEVFDLLFNLTFSRAKDSACRITSDANFELANLYSAMEAFYRGEVYGRCEIDSRLQVLNALYQASVFELTWGDVCRLEEDMIKTREGELVDKVMEERVSLDIVNKHGHFYVDFRDGVSKRLFGKDLNLIYNQAISEKIAEIRGRGTVKRNVPREKYITSKDLDLACNYFKKD